MIGRGEECFNNLFIKMSYSDSKEGLVMLYLGISNTQADNRASHSHYKIFPRKMNFHLQRDSK